MRENYKQKFIECKALDVDTIKRQVKVAIAKVEALDRDGEVFYEKAFDKTIKENGPAGSNEIWHLLDHGGGLFGRGSFSALSKAKEVGKDGEYIYLVSQYKDSFAWREVAWPLYEAGDFNQHSVGFTITKDSKNDEGFKVLKEVRLWEGSAVLWGAQPDSPVLQLMKSEFDDELDGEELIYARFEKAIKRLKDDKFNDGNKSLLTIELLRLQNNFVSLAQKATKPDADNDQSVIRGSDLKLVMNRAQKSTLPDADVKQAIKQAFEPINSHLNIWQNGNKRYTDSRTG